MKKEIVYACKFPFPIREDEAPGAWQLDWLKDLPNGGTRRLLRDAQTFVLQNDGERLIIASQPDQENLQQAMLNFPSETVSHDGARYILQLIIPDDDGTIHDDYDFNTPLRRINCVTCITRIAEDRLKRRNEVFGQNPVQPERAQWVRAVAEHSRLVGEAYLRLAEIEAQIAEDIAAR